MVLVKLIFVISFVNLEVLIFDFLSVFFCELFKIVEFF